MVRLLDFLKHFRPMAFIQRAARLQWSSDSTFHKPDCPWVINYVAWLVLIAIR